MIEDGLAEDSKDPAELYAQMLSVISKLVDKDLAKTIKDVLLVDGYKNGFRPFIGYFLYHRYDKDAIIKELVENTSWRVTSEEEHFDCMIHHGALYLKNLVARRSHLMPEISVQIREGTITREEGLEKLKTNDDVELANKEIKMLCDYAGISYKKLMLKAKIYAKRWW